MSEQILINEKIAKAVMQAVHSVNPALAERFFRSMTKEPVERWLHVPQGGGAGDKYGLNLSIEDAEAVNKCLKKLEGELPYNATFNHYQINYLASQWPQLLQELKTKKLPNKKD